MDDIPRQSRSGAGHVVNIRRCKTCRFYRPYVSDIENPAAIRFMNLQAPKSKPRACVLRLKDATNGDGEDVKVPSLDREDQKGKHYGRRVSPFFVCDYYAAKHPPYRRPVPATFVGKPQVLSLGSVKQVGVEPVVLPAGGIDASVTT